MDGLLVTDCLARTSRWCPHLYRSRPYQAWPSRMTCCRCWIHLRRLSGYSEAFSQATSVARDPSAVAQTFPMAPDVENTWHARQPYWVMSAAASYRRPLSVVLHFRTASDAARQRDSWNQQNLHGRSPFAAWSEAWRDVCWSRRSDSRSHFAKSATPTTTKTTPDGTHIMTPPSCWS